MSKASQASSPSAAETMPQWIIGRESSNPGGNLFIVHVAEPSFVARWHIGAMPAKSDFVDDDGEAPIAIYDATWHGPEPVGEAFQALMRQAIKAIDVWLDSCKLETPRSPRDWLSMVHTPEAVSSLVHGRPANSRLGLTESYD